MRDFTIGAGCGDDGAARIATLVERGERRRLLNVLRGGNPEGRWLAFAALRTAGGEASLSEEDRAAMRLVESSPLPLRFCDGGTLRMRAGA